MGDLPRVLFLKVKIRRSSEVVYDCLKCGISMMCEIVKEEINSLPSNGSAG